MNLQDMLQHLVEANGSDLHLKAGSAPHLRVEGKLVVAPFPPPDPDTIAAIANAVLPPARVADLEQTGSADVAHSVPGLGRFRINVYRQRGSLALAIRRVVPGIPQLSELNLPDGIRRLADEERGLVIIAGPAGAGTTTTAAAVIDRINETRAVHIVTVEDPIEVLHADKQSIVSQREVGMDAPSMADAVRSALRQDPDVIFVGDLRSVDAFKAVIDAAETGKLVIAVTRASTVLEVVDRLLDLLPLDQQRQGRVSLGRTLRGIACQRLLDRADGNGRTAVVEVAVGTTKVLECVVDPEKFRRLPQILAEGEYHGMQTFDQALLRSYREGLVSMHDAMAVASDPEDFRISVERGGGY